jgi:hypothetical protein
MQNFKKKKKKNREKPQTLHIFFKDLNLDLQSFWHLSNQIHFIL